VVVPSIPGSGFSDRPRERGMTSARVAALWARLMTEVLGYGRYGAAGSDIGSTITQFLALSQPGSVAGIHLTDIGFYFMNAGQPDLSEAERAHVAKIQQWWMQEGAYALLHSTRPQPLAYGPTESPVGLAAWLVEKFRSWSDCGGEVGCRFAGDELLTQIMLYWVTRTIGSPIRLYHEGGHAPPSIQPGRRIEVPAGFAVFRDNPVPLPRAYAERHLDVRHDQHRPPAPRESAEEPELFAEDLRAFFRPLRSPR
jgi:pimeloyl-ACP methyl ester carboxylesterase